MNLCVQLLHQNMAKRKADTMNLKMERIMKKRTLILGEEAESEDDPVPPHPEHSSESGLKSAASLCDGAKQQAVVKTNSAPETEFMSKAVTEMEDPLNENNVPPEKEADPKGNPVPQEPGKEADPKENHVPQEPEKEADPKENDVCTFPATIDELACFLKEAGYKTRDNVRDFAACCANAEESYFNCLVQKVHGDKRSQPFTQHTKEFNHLSENDWFFGMDHVEDLADFIWYIMQVSARAALRGTKHGLGRAAKPKVKNAPSSSRNQPKAKVRNAKAVEKSKDKPDCALPAQHAEMEPPAELPGQDADSPNKYQKNKALLQAYKPEWSFLESALHKKLLACTHLRVQL